MNAISALEPCAIAFVHNARILGESIDLEMLDWNCVTTPPWPIRIAVIPEPSEPSGEVINVDESDNFADPGGSRGVMIACDRWSERKVEPVSWLE